MSEIRSARMAARPAPRRSGAAEAVAIPALRLVDASGRPRRRALTKAVTVLVSALAAAGLFGVVCLHVFLTQGQGELDALHARADQAEARNGQLTVDVAQLEAPARVVGWARQHLGMVPLAAVSYLPAADPAAPLPPVPDGPLPTVPGAAGSTTATGSATSSGPAPVSSATTPTTAPKSSSTATTVTHRQAPSSTVAARNP